MTRFVPIWFWPVAVKVWFWSFAASIALVIGWWLCGCSERRSDPTTDFTMDRYSFCVGVWCATRTAHPGWGYEEFSSGYREILDGAMEFSQTNGFPPFEKDSGPHRIGGSK